MGNGDDANDRYEPHAFARLEKTPRAVSAGASHTVVVTGDGELFGVGYDSFGQTGVLGAPLEAEYDDELGQLVKPEWEKESMAREEREKRLIPFFNDSRVSFSGFKHTHVKDSAEDGVGEESRATRVVSRLTKAMYPEDVEFSGVSCGAFHTAAIGLTNRIKPTAFAWGRSDFGRCGAMAKSSHPGEEDSVPIWLVLPVAALSLLDVEPGIVAAGGFFTIIVDRSGRRAFSFGGNGNGELGSGTKSQFEHKPQRIVFPFATASERIIKVSCGGFHTAALTTLGRVVVWGDNHSKQCLLDSQIVNVASPTELQVGDVATDVSCGTIFTTVATKKGGVKLYGGSPSMKEPMTLVDGLARGCWLPDKQGAYHGLIGVN